MAYYSNNSLEGTLPDHKLLIFCSPESVDSLIKCICPFLFSCVRARRWRNLFFENILFCFEEFQRHIRHLFHSSCVHVPATTNTTIHCKNPVSQWNARVGGNYDITTSGQSLTNRGWILQEEDNRLSCSQHCNIFPWPMLACLFLSSARLLPLKIRSFSPNQNQL